MSLATEYTYVTTLRLDERDQVVLDALVEHERVPKNHLFRVGLRLLGRGAAMPDVAPVTRRTPPSISIRLDAPDELILQELHERQDIAKSSILRAGLHALAHDKNLPLPKRRRRKATAA